MLQVRLWEKHMADTGRYEWAEIFSAAMVKAGTKIGSAQTDIAENTLRERLSDLETSNTSLPEQRAIRGGLLMLGRPIASFSHGQG
jgi:hypothetical protein